MRLGILLTIFLASCVSDESATAPNRSQGSSRGTATTNSVSSEAELHPFETYAANDIRWKPGPASLPAGAQIAVLEGDPTREGPFVFRLKLPDGFLIKPHIHPRAERVTVIQGTFNISMHDNVAEAQKPGNFDTMRAGSFGYWPARMPHVAWTSGGGGGSGGETIAQFHGHGPWIIHYLNAADDPRNAPKR